MLNKYSKQVLVESGLVETGLNEEGEMEYIGTDKEWVEANRLQEKQDLFDLERQQSREREYEEVVK